MSRGPESRLTSSILKEVRQAWPGSFWFKVVGGPFQAIGLPDIIGCVEGRFIGLEVKLPGEPHPLSPTQARCLRLIEEAGGVSGVVHSVDEAMDTIRRWCPTP